MKKVFGLKQISRKVNELLFKDVKYKSEPEKWKWTPHNPEKIRNLKEAVEKEKDEVNFACISNYEPGEQKQKVLLVFAVGNLSYAMIRNLEKERVKFFFVDYVQFILQGTLTISIDNEKEVKFIEIEGLRLNLDDVGAVIWNPPKIFKPLFDFDHIPPTRGRNQFIYKKRWIQFLKELPHLLNDDVVWLPGTPFHGTQDWQNKLGEYSLARKVGLHVPPIICTNNFQKLRDFEAENGTTLLIREFSTPPFSFPPIRIENLHALSFKHFENSPSCWQKYVEKKFEMRVVVLFDEVFPCKIHSQDSELAKYDWRVYDDENVKWELSEIPVEVKEKLLVLTRRLNLNWCSIDLIYGNDDNYYYLEANRPGSHYWLEYFVGLDITREIIMKLMQMNCVEKYA